MKMTQLRKLITKIAGYAIQKSKSKQVIAKEQKLIKLNMQTSLNG